MSRDRIRLEGFNNLTKVVSFNLYEFAIAKTPEQRRQYAARIDREFSAARITDTLRSIAEIIDAEVLSVSSKDYEPQGSSALVLMSDLGHTRSEEVSGATVGAHLSKSHLCAHTYPDWHDPNGICNTRIDIDISTCGTIVPLRALDYIFSRFAIDLVIIDYVVRGFTRDCTGKRVYMDHTVKSIRDFIRPEVVGDYHCEDLVLENENIWKTKMLRTSLDPSRYFASGVDPETSESRLALEALRQEMVGIYYGWPG
ncbi:MAG: S-adenosylmethionine decarboxylase [Nannocystaceae bacterium]